MKPLQFLLSLLILLTSDIALAENYDFAITPLSYSITSSNTVKVVGPYGYNQFEYDAPPFSLVIPSEITYNGVTYSVTAIADNAFNYPYPNDITSLTIPESVTYIGDYAFAKNRISEVNIPASVEYIGKDAFGGYWAYHYGSDNEDYYWVNYPETYNVSSANQYYSSYKGILYDKNQTKLIDCPNAYSGDIYLPSTLKEIPSGAFSGSGYHNLYIYDLSRFCEINVTGGSGIGYGSINNIYYRGDNQWNNIEYEYLDFSISSNNNHTFYIPTDVTKIGRGIFYGFKQFRNQYTSVSFPTMGVTEIGDYAFARTKITNVTLPATLQSIGQNAFYEQWNEEQTDIIEYDEDGDPYHPYITWTMEMSSLTIPQSVQSIGSNAFNLMNGAIVTSKSNSPNDITSDAFKNASNCTLTVGEGLQSTYSQKTGWNAFGTIIEDEGITPYVDGEVFTATTTEGIEMTFKVISAANRTAQVGDGSNPAIDQSYDGNLVVPSEINGLIVTDVGCYAFYRCQNLQSVTIEEGIKRLGTWGNEHNMTYGPFYQAKVMGSVTLPGTLTYIGMSTFEYAEIGEITLPPSLESIEVCAFFQAQIGSIDIPYSASNLYYNYEKVSGDNWTAFGHTKIDKLTLDRVLYNENSNRYPFVSATINKFYVGPSGEFRLMSCSVTNYYPKVTETFNSSGFDSYTSCVNLFLPEGYTSITSVPHGSTQLKSISIPSTITSITEDAFSDTYLSSVTVNIREPLAIGANTFARRTYSTLYVPYGSKAAYEAADYWKEFKEIVEMVSPTSPAIIFADANVKALCVANWDTNGDRELSESEAAAVTNLGEVFKGNTDITSFNELQYFTGLVSIGDNAFNDCSSLTSVTLPESVTTIGEFAFHASGLESISFPSALTEVGAESFSSCENLESIDFNGCHATFEHECFAWCFSLEELNVPNTVRFEGWNPFWGCTSLRTAIFEPFEEGQEPWNVLGLFNSDYFTSVLETVVLPSFDVMWSDCLQKCTNLESVTFLSGAPSGNSQHFVRNFFGSPDDILFNIPEGSAESYLRAGFRNLSDKSGLPLVREEFEAEAARIATMADAVSDGDQESLTSAIDEARDVVNNTDDYMTVYAQIAAVKSAAKTFLSTATLPQDFDVTAATITNPDFDRFDIGWKVDYVAENMGRLDFEGVNHWGNGDVVVDNFIETYKSEGTLGNGGISQTITNLPAGIYRFEADIIASNEFDSSAEVTGVSLFAVAGNLSTPVSTEFRMPQHFSVKFENPTARDVTVGINITGTNANWVAADNFRLYYEGEAADIPQGADLVSDETARVYLYNVETGKYLSAGHSCGTHAILDETGLPVRLTKDSETGLWQIYFWEGSGQDQLLFKVYPESGYAEDEVFVDYNHDNEHADENFTWWNFVEVDDGSYLIQNQTNANTDFWLGNNPARQDCQENYGGITYTDLICTASTSNNSHWLIFSKDDCDKLAAQHRLMSAILRTETADAEGYAELIASAYAVYNNEEATTEEIISITTLLNSQLGMPAEDQPVDMTAIITNPRFEYNTTEGWSGATVVGGRSDATSNNEQEFFERSFDMYQVITGVPNGRYLLKWKGYHRPGSNEDNCNAYSGGTDNASAVVYANAEEKTMKNVASEVSDQQLGGDNFEFNGQYIPNSMEDARQFFNAGYYADQLEVEVTDNVLTIGVKSTQEMGSEHWVVFSDFELYILENAEQLNNKLIAVDAQGVPGGTTRLPVNLTNADDIVSATFRITLPEGVTPVTTNGEVQISTTSRVPSGMTIAGNVNGQGVCSLAIMPGAQKITAGEGTIFYITVTSDVAMELGNYELTLDDVKLINEDLLRIQPFASHATLTLKEPETGDVNGDGDTDILDATIIVYNYLGRPVGTFTKSAGDINGDGDTDILDATIIVYRYLGRISSNPAPRRRTFDLEPE